MTRHNPEKDALEPEAPLQVGNGSLAVGVDETGLQTFDEAWTNTLSDWGWHTAPPPEDGGLDGYERQTVESHGRALEYMLPGEGQDEAVEYLRANPHRIDLGRIGFAGLGERAPSVDPDAVEGVSQTLDLWSGVVASEFELDGERVAVETCCHPYRDAVAVRVESPLVASGRLGVALAFPGPDASYMATNVGDWDSPDDHATELRRLGDDAVGFERTLDDDAYSAALAWEGEAAVERRGDHRYALVPEGSSELSFVCSFSPDGSAEPPEPTFGGTRRTCAEHWPAFWRTGAAVDLSESDDPRWEELERRAVLSQYVMAVNAAGSSPSQESGLVNNTWFGKFHLEMTLWNGLHFALWGREYLLEGWLDWFLETGLPAARRNAERVGLDGARWQKMVDPSAEWQSPGAINPFRENQQGHAIYWAEQCYRIRPARETLERYADLVFETADYMADFAAWDPETERYVLGPPVITGTEGTDGLDAANPTIELSYWAYGLETAQRWRERLGKPRKAEWDDVLENLAEPPTVDGEYVPLETHPEMEGIGANPAWLQAYGCMPGTNVDPAKIEATYDRVVSALDEWELWGANFPALAMAAARLGHPGEAVDILLHDHPQNEYETNGINVMQDDEATPTEGAYLPGNGGVLWALAFMIAGWDGVPDERAPGFPDGWTVRSEGFRPTQ